MQLISTCDMKLWLYYELVIKYLYFLVYLFTLMRLCIIKLLIINYFILFTIILKHENSKNWKSKLDRP
jgi:hypothetical protein